ncbi:hypothetical protein ACFFR6_25320 [Saccharothrix mutabilis subsp. capreolus]|uniref:hypothetical protein n=1 Tax=Saccharothrix mutabilis TaxID=33921 RepID=UPI0035EB5AF0|nr:hypothetical protein GCM10017745_20580 [Saccharothrix mutabilis subsp. capreolus]
MDVHNVMSGNTHISVQAGKIGGSVVLRTPWLPIALVVAIVAATATYVAAVAQQPRYDVTLATRLPRVPQVTPSPLPPGTRRASEYVTAPLFGSAATKDGLVTITVIHAQSLSSLNGSYDVSGGQQGPGRGSASVHAPERGEPGGVAFGVAGFTLTLPTASCSAPSVPTGESVVAVERNGWWTRVSVVHVGHFPPDSDALPVRFLVERGDGDPPAAVRRCA